MASDLDRIIQLTITRSTTVTSMASFNGILIAAEFLKSDAKTAFSDSERVRSYSGIDEIAEDFATTSFIYKMANVLFEQDPTVETIYVGRKLTGTDGTETWDTALTAMLKASSAWYGLLVSTRALADQEVIASWVESNDKLCIFASADAANVDDDYNATTPACIADYIKANNLDRSSVIYHPDAATSYPDAAWLGYGFAHDPGSINWAYITLTGVEVYSLTSSQFSKAAAKNCNVYTSLADVNCTQFGTVGSGEYIDVIHGIDWLGAKIQNLIFTAIKAQGEENGKVPFTDAGVQIIVNALKSALDAAVTVRLLASYDVTYPEVTDVSSTYKGTRLLPDIKFTGELAGAINKVKLSGVVTL
jgi:hypothetical protein